MRSCLRFIGFTAARPSVDFSSRSELANFAVPPLRFHASDSTVLASAPLQSPFASMPRPSFPEGFVELYLPRFRPSSRLPVRSSTSCRRIPTSVSANRCRHPLDPDECRLFPALPAGTPPIARAQTVLTLHPNVLPPSDFDEYRYLPMTDPCCHDSVISKHRYLPPPVECCHFSDDGKHRCQATPLSVATSRMLMSNAARRFRSVLPRSDPIEHRYPSVSARVATLRSR